MKEDEFQVSATAGEMRTFFVSPDASGERPLAIISPDGLGYRDDLKALARRFASAGFCCALPDWTYRFGEPLDPFADPSVIVRQRQRIAEMLANPASTYVPDAQAVIEFAGTEKLASTDRVVAVGYCWGGIVSIDLLSAFPDQVVAGAGFHPFWIEESGEFPPMDRSGAPEPPQGRGDVPAAVLQKLEGIRGELYLGVPSSDFWISQASFAFLGDAIAKRGVRGKVEVYRDALHGFAVPGGPTPDSPAAERAMSETIALWKRNLN